MKRFPVIDPVATGRNISRLRRAKGLSVRDVQQWFGFEEPQAIYKWQQGRSLPSVDNLYALCTLLEVSMEELLVEQTEESDEEQPDDPGCSQTVDKPSCMMISEGGGVCGGTVRVPLRVQ